MQLGITGNVFLFLASFPEAIPFISSAVSLAKKWNLSSLTGLEGPYHKRVYLKEQW